METKEIKVNNQHALDNPHYYVDDSEFVNVELDALDKVLSGTKTDGSHYIYNVLSETIDSINSQILNKVDKDENKGLSSNDYTNEDKEIVNTYELFDEQEYLSVELDTENKIIGSRKPDGTKVENVGIETNKLTLSTDGLDDLGKALKNGGYSDMTDWSNEKFIEIPIPQVCAIVNFGVDSQATSKSDRYDYNPGVNADIPTFIEFWDKQGNYFKKPILLSAQGSSSMNYWIKNQGFDLDDGSSIKFGNWVAQDSFHVKKYYIDVFRGQCVVGYWLTEQMYQTRPYGERRPWDYMNQGGSTTNSIGKFRQDYDTGALAHPDGFPVHVFFNGNDAGIYAFNLKKHRDNYYAKKDNAKNIILDGELGNLEIFGGAGVTWTSFEIRNPKGLKLVDGSKYDGDHPSEITGDSNVDPLTASVKSYIERLAEANRNIRLNKTKETFEQYFNVPFFIDYFLVSLVLYHYDGFWKNWIWCTWDGLIWTPTSYDMDSIFGSSTDGTRTIPAGEYHPINEYVTGETNAVIGISNVIIQLLEDLYMPEIKNRYKELRDKSIFSTDNIVSLLEKWVNTIGYENLKDDIENICAFESVPLTPSYRDGSQEYVKTPTTGGFYNSILRVKRWLDEHFAYLDSSYAFDYNQN